MNLPGDTALMSYYLGGRRLDFLSTYQQNLYFGFQEHVYCLFLLSSLLSYLTAGVDPEAMHRRGIITMYLHIMHIVSTIDLRCTLCTYILVS